MRTTTSAYREGKNPAALCLFCEHYFGVGEGQWTGHFMISLLYLSVFDTMTVLTGSTPAD